VTDDLGYIRTIRIEDEMRDQLLDYAMSVESWPAALPDVRDGPQAGSTGGFLYAMGEMGLASNASYTASGRPSSAR